MSIPINNLNDQLAMAKIEERGFTPTSAFAFNHGILGVGSITCYLVRIKESDRAFMIRGDTGEIYDSQEFWDKFGSRTLSGPWIELNENE